MLEQRSLYLSPTKSHIDRIQHPVFQKTEYIRNRNTRISISEVSYKKTQRPSGPKLNLVLKEASLRQLKSLAVGHTPPLALGGKNGHSTHTSAPVYWALLALLDRRGGTGDVQGQVNLKNRIADICHVKELKVEKVSHTDREVKNTELRRPTHHVHTVISSHERRKEKGKKLLCSDL